ncbi:MAG: fibrobacter succinogenes major paralogous domain-containing protein [Bacteroidales bacterium]|nr:fibrobacter succinogenes major paralogous domain-containing protein [Bacteroidales bacterium]
MNSCKDDPEPKITTVTDIDGNVYQVVTIGFYEWTVENLRVTNYNNGDPIPTGLSNDEWASTTEGAYAINLHENADGINSPEEMVEAYGKLYNWYAVADSRGLCPQGWSVPSDNDWTRLVDYVVAEGFPNESDNPNGAGNALKSCRQVNSPLGGECNTSTHPRWISHSDHLCFDEFGFSALPGGSRWNAGYFTNVGHLGLWWSAAEFSGSTAWRSSMRGFYGDVSISYIGKNNGYSVRCLRDID